MMRFDVFLPQGGVARGPMWPLAEASFSSWFTEFLSDLQTPLGLSWWQWLLLMLLAGGAVAVGTLLQSLLIAGGRIIGRRTATEWDDKIVEAMPGPTRVLLALLLLRIFVPILELPAVQQENLETVLRVLLIVSVTWIVLRLIKVGAEIIEAFMSRGVANESRLRSIHTQISVPRGILRFIVILVGTAFVCFQFEVVREIGVSLMASAGVAGVILGFAAQRTISNLLAGIQIAFTQAVKIGDVVIAENEWGWIEEITLTYVVVKVWDQRRLILPVSYFLERPFQNWTRQESELLGTVFLYVDYTIPVESVRKELQRIVEKTEKWDRRAQGVQVTNLTEKTVELRALVSAKDGGTLWDLRCHVREQLLTWLQSQGHGHLPQFRVEMNSRPEGK